MKQKIDYVKDVQAVSEKDMLYLKIKKSTSASIDIAKFIAAILVIALHTGFLKEIPYCGFLVRTYVTRFAVPFFFIASGYFLFGRMQYTEDFKISGQRIMPKVYCGISDILVCFILHGQSPI